MLSPSYTKQFEKDLKLMIKRGKNVQKIKEVITLLLEEKPLPLRHRDHKLLGNYKDRRDCHVEPDWVLIYKPEPENSRIVFERTGTHSDLFR
jgi:mRNA interferase YafQ